MPHLLLFALIVSACAAPDSAPEPAPTDSPSPSAAAPAEADSLGAAAAADMVRRYYAAVDAGDYRSAFALRGPTEQTFVEFAEGYARTAHVTADVGTPSRVEGAAGSIYATVPVVVRARMTDGEEQTFEGEYVVRRVNDVPGATPAQLRWHIGSADLRRVD